MERSTDPVKNGLQFWSDMNNFLALSRQADTIHVVVASAPDIIIIIFSVFSVVH
jgi:hypothetical protein